MTTPDSPLVPFCFGDAPRATFSIRPPEQPPLPNVDGLLAGAAEVDITPPPGLPKAGYSSHANLGNGFRTRLRARVLHLRAGTTSLALVQCDLLGGSALVHHLVARAVAERTDVPLAGIVIGATHTHAGPGQFLSTDFYNRFASNKSGFDPAWTDWLVQRIAGGILEAHDTRRPARMAVGSTEVWGLTRNRSLRPHVRNTEVVDQRTDPQRKWVSVNPLLHLIRVDTIDTADATVTTPLAATVVFSVHGTGISMHAPEYNADLWAYLVGELGNRIEAAHGTRAVCGAIEGTHADVAPALRPTRAGHVEAARVGRAIGAEAAALHDRLGLELRDDLVLAAGLRELDLERTTTADTPTGPVAIPRRPAVGAALIAGAHENVTPVLWRIPPFKAGSPKPWATKHPQGRKWVIGTRWLQPIVLPLDAFPRVVPVSVLRLGDTALVGLPFEITVMSGRRIEAAVARAAEEAGTPVERVIVSSVANEYYGYLATPEEYDLQYYEGGHTLYGRPAQPFFTAQAAAWARLVLGGGATGAGVISDVLAERRFDLKARRFLPAVTATHAGESTGAAHSVERAELGPARFVDPTPGEDGYWEATVIDAEPARLHWHEPLARVECSDDGGHTWRTARSRDGLAVDDQGWQLEVSHHGPLHDGRDITAGEPPRQPGDPVPHRFTVRWHDPTFRDGRIHRFVLLANADRPQLAGTPFD